MRRLWHGLAMLAAPALLVAASAPYWWGRLFYDDELHTLALGGMRDPAAVWQAASGWDIHPPLHYVYAWLWLRAPVAPETAGTASGLLATAAALVVLWLLLVRAERWPAGRATLGCMLAAAHPLVLLHCSAFRWYPLWSALALGVIYSTRRCLQQPAAWRGIALGLVMGCSLLCSYLTLPLLAGLAVWAGILLWRRRPGGDWWRAALPAAGLALATLAVCLLAYLEPMSGHLANSQQGSAMAWWRAASLDLFSLVVGQSVFPWQWHWTILAAISCLALLTLARDRLADSPVSLLLLILGAEVVLLGALTGFVKARSFMLLGLLAGPVIVELAGRSRLRWAVVAPLLLVWMIGDINVVRKTHLHRAHLQDPVAAVVAAARRSAGAEPTLVLVTHPVVAYYLGKQSQKADPQFGLCSPWSLAAIAPVERGCPPSLSRTRRILLLDSYLGGTLMPARAEYDAMRAALGRWADGGKLVARLGQHPGWRGRNRWGRVDGMRRWRFRLVLYESDQPPPSRQIRTFFETALHRPDTSR